MDTGNVIYMKRALITGINGFVGPYLKNELEQSGYTVFGLGTKPYKDRPNYYVADITDRDRVREVLNVVKPEYVFHLAGISSPPFAEKNSELTYRVNVEGTRNLLDAASALPSAPRILIVGSAHVYGEPLYLPIDEQHPLQGQGVYVDSRLRQEELVWKYRASLPFTITRSFNHTGPGQSDTFVVPKIVKQAIEVQKGLRRQLDLGNLDVKRDITHVLDVVRAYRLLMEQPKTGVISNVCRGESIVLKDIVEYARVLTQCDDMPVAISPDFVRSGDAPDIYGSIALLRTLIDWQPQFDYQVMIADMYHFWNQHVS